jgi:hypothetical protein
MAERLRANPSVVLLIGVLAAAAVVLMGLGWRLGFFLDDWTFLLYRRGTIDQAVLNPHGENIVIGLSLAYKFLVNVFGMDSAVPFRAALVGLVLTSGVLLFALLRERVGDYLAVVAVAMTVFLGAAYEDLLWAIQIGYFISLCCGLGAFLALERRTDRADLLACGLLTVGVTSFSVGIPFIAGAAVAIALSGRRWRRRAYVVAVPIAVYALWWLGWGHDADTKISLINILTSPGYLLEGFSSSLASMLGLATPGTDEAIGFMSWGRPLLAAAVLLGGYRLYRLGRVPEWLWVFGATALAYWLLAGFNERPGREATVSRYQHIGAIFILLIAAELCRGMRIRRPAMVVITALAGVAIVSNLSYLSQARDSYLHTTVLERAGLGAMEIARDTVEPSFVLAPNLVETGYVYVDALHYLPAVDDYGSPAYSPEELRDAPEEARRVADKTVGAALRMTFTAGTGMPAADGEAPEVVSGETLSAQGACVAVRPPAGGPAVLSLAPGGAGFETKGAGSTDVQLRRFATESFPINGGTMTGDDTATLAIPLDRASEPWEVELGGTRTVRVCGTAPA